MIKSLNIAGLSIILLTSTACSSQGVEPVHAARGYDALQACLMDVLNARQFHGVVTVSHADTIILELAQDAHEGEAGTFDTQSRFNTGSMFKMITAVGVVQLAERGALNFDDALSEHIPDLPEAFQSLQISDLLSHTSGMGNYLSPRNLEVIQSHTSLVDLMPLILADEPVEIGEYRYSNSGYVMLGLLIEAVSGQKYEDYIEDHILQPAGMASTGLYPDEETVQAYTRMVPGQRPGPETSSQPFRPSHLSGGRGMPAGGAYTTTGDLVRFANALVSGDLVSLDMFELMSTGQAFIRNGDKGPIYYGYGFNIRNNGTSIGHGGGGPGINGELRFQPDSGWVIATLTNIDPRMASETNSALERALSDPSDPAYCIES